MSAAGMLVKHNLLNFGVYGKLPYTLIYRI